MWHSAAGPSICMDKSFWEGGVFVLDARERRWLLTDSDLGLYSSPTRYGAAEQSRNIDSPHVPAPRAKTGANKLTGQLRWQSAVAVALAVGMFVLYTYGGEWGKNFAGQAGMYIGMDYDFGTGWSSWSPDVIAAMATSRDASVTPMEFVWPVPEMMFSSGGQSVQANAGQENVLRIISPGGAVVAAATGVVSFVGPAQTAAGLLIVIEHEEGWQTIYEGLQAVYVAPGQLVRSRQELGNLGSASAGGVLEFSVTRHGKKVAPLPLLRLRDGGQDTPPRPDGDVLYLQ